jgi:hypothetical protein
MILVGLRADEFFFVREGKMRIPLPPMPRWFDRFLDWSNADFGPKLWKFQPRRLDLFIVIWAIIVSVVDGLYFHPWAYALIMEPLFVTLGLMSAIWFIRKD